MTHNIYWYTIRSSEGVTNDSHSLKFLVV